MPRIFSRPNVDQCIEKAFFKAIIIIVLVTVIILIMFDLIVFGKLATSIQLTTLVVLVLVVILYAFEKIPFDKITLMGLLAICILFTYRGLTTDEFNGITYTVLIALGFVGSLVSRNYASKGLVGFIFVCLLTMLLKDIGASSTAVIIRQAIPYISVFFIVTVCSAYLKNRYEENQIRLRDMVALLNQKNRRINEQNVLLQKKFKELEELNQNLEAIIDQKTAKISEKNRQLANVAYANAHTVRGPLARILGLLNLSTIDAQNKEFYFEKLHKEANDLDEVLFVVSNEIEKHIHR